MGDITTIQWTDKTFNPWIGCTEVSPGCLHCYAKTCTRARVLRHRGQETWGKGAQRSRTSKANWRKPIAWNAAAEGNRRRTRVFCASLADWLDDEVPAVWLYDLLDLIQCTPWLDWQLLTKRPQNFESRLRASMDGHASDRADDFIDAWLDGKAPENVWMGTTVEDQARADVRIPQLLKIPAAVRFLSCEPLLEEVTLERVPLGSVCECCGHPVNVNALTGFTGCHGDCDGPTMGRLHWVIVGGESGPGARVCDVDDAYELVQQCQAAGVPVFVKQLGSNAMGRGRFQPSLIAMEDRKGGNMLEWHADLRIRQFPAVLRRAS